MNIRTLYLLFFITGIHTTALAGGTYFYSMKATVIMKDGTLYEGYFSLVMESFIERDEKGFYYTQAPGITMRLRSEEDGDNAMKVNETDYHFHTYIHRLLHDSVKLYEDVVFIHTPHNSETIEAPISAYIGKPVSLYKPDIQDLTIHRVTFSGANVYSSFTKDDMEWLSGKVLKSEVCGGVELCTYYALYFNPNKKATQPLIDALMDLYKKQIDPVTDHGDLHPQITETVERLKKEKVIVVSYCSC
jgi:hypothetical protein